MKGDFSADRFDPGKNFSAVLKQQGRVDLDSDWNEQVAIQQRLLRTLIADLLGPAAGPAGACGFGPSGADGAAAAPAEGDFGFGPGRYYVDGLLVENRAATLYSRQPFAGAQDKLTSGRRYLAYLDVWERHVTWLDDAELREPALGGIDTCTRRQIVWAVKVIDMGPAGANAVPGAGEIAAEIGELSGWTSGRLAARLSLSETDNPLGGLENHLYRIEVHQSGHAGDSGNPPSFKWSRDNGSVTAPLLGQGGALGANALRVDGADRFSHGCCIELLSEADDLHGRGGHLGRVVGVGDAVLTLLEPPPKLGGETNPRVRRWDHDPQPGNAGGAVAIVPGGWLMIENGLEIRFSGGAYRAGDYWQIVTRAETGIAWPKDVAGLPLEQPPKGIAHHYAPLFLFDATASPPFVEILQDCRSRVAPMAGSGP